MLAVRVVRAAIRAGGNGGQLGRGAIEGGKSKR